MGLLIATTRPGGEEHAALELGDALFRRDPQVDPRPSGFRGTVIVETRLDSLHAYLILVGQVLSHIRRLVPLYPPPRLVQLAKERLDPGALGAVHVRCELRGRREECDDIVEGLLRELGSLESPRSRASLVLHVEGVLNRWGAMLLPRGCDNLDKLYGDPGLRRTCIGFVKKIIAGATRNP